MNPDTNKFEKLQDSGIVDEFIKKRMEDMEMRSDLVRPDGSPVPKSWTIFSVDELVEIKGYTFKVAHIGESHVLFEPVKSEDKVIKKYEGTDACPKCSGKGYYFDDNQGCPCERCSGTGKNE